MHEEVFCTQDLSLQYKTGNPFFFPVDKLKMREIQDSMSAFILNT